LRGYKRINIERGGDLRMSDIEERFADGLDIINDDWCSSNDTALIIS
jgi:hypothetical protein